MKLEELDKMAISDMAIEKTMPLMDYAYCMKMRELYTDYRKGLITLDSCKKRKEEIIREYKKASSCLEIYEKYQDNIMKSEALRIEINRSNDLQETLLKSLEIVSLLTGDETFYKINARKLGDNND